MFESVEEFQQWVKAPEQKTPPRDAAGKKGSTGPLFADVEELRKWAEEPEPSAAPAGRPGAKKKPEELRGALSETASALGAGVVSTAEVIGATAEMLGIPGGKTAREEWQRIGQSDALRRPDYLQDVDVWKQPGAMADWRWWIRALGESTPNTLTMILPGMAAIRGAQALGWGLKAIRAIGLAGGWGGSFTLEAGGAYGQAKDEMTQAGILDADMIEKIATMEGIAAGTVNALIELFPFDNLVLKQAGADRFLKRVVRQTFLEGLTESAQEAVNIYVEKLGHKPDQKWSDNIGRILESGIIGGMMGGTMGATLGTHEHSQNVKHYNALGDQLGIKDTVFALKDAGTPDKEIVAQVDVSIKDIRAKNDEISKGADALAGGTEVKDVAQKPEISEVDAEEMVTYLLYGEGKYTPPPGISSRVATKAKRGILGVFGMKEKAAAPAVTAPAETTAASETAGTETLMPEPQAVKDVGLAEPEAEKIKQEKKAEARKKGETLFDNVMTELNQEGQQRLEAARQQEILQRGAEEKQAAIDTETESQIAIVQAKAEQEALTRELAAGDPKKQAIVAEVMGLSDRIVISTAQKDLGLNVQPAGQDRYEIVTAAGAKPVPVFSLRKLLAEKYIGDFSAAEKKRQDDFEAVRRRTEAAKIKKGKEIADWALSHARESLGYGRAITTQQLALLEASRDQLTQEEIARLDAGPNVVKPYSPPKSLEILGVRGKTAAAEEKPAEKTAPAAKDEVQVDEDEVRAYIHAELATQLEEIGPTGWVENGEGEGKRIAAGGWISRTVKTFGRQSTTPLRDEKGQPVTLNLSKDYLANVIDKASSGKTLTEQQQAVYDVIIHEARDEDTQARTILTRAKEESATDFNPDEFTNEGKAAPATAQGEETAGKTKEETAAGKIVQPVANSEINAAANEAATSPDNKLPEPTPAQQEAGHYKKGHVNYQGLDISIENPAGSSRKSVDKNGKAWERTLASHYGYIKQTEGKDGDHVDVFIPPDVDLESDKVFVVDQKDDKSGKFDEHKVMLGFDSKEKARQGYLSNYDESGPDRIMDITEMTVDAFKTWLKDGDQTKPAASWHPKKAVPSRGVAIATGQPTTAKKTEKQPWEMTREEYTKLGMYPEIPEGHQSKAAIKAENEQNHKEWVSQALAEGKPVPPEVLKDYPELQKTAPSQGVAIATGQKTPAAVKAAAKGYLDEQINYGGEIRSRGSVINEMQGQGIPQDRIDAYMMGAKSVPVEDAGSGKLEDFGEKIGGARKDTAERGFSTAGKAKKEEDGPSWKKRYVAAESVHTPGQWTIIDTRVPMGMYTRRGQAFSSKEAAEEAIPLYAVARQHDAYHNSDGTYSIMKKTGERKRLKVVNQNFPSREEAMKYMATHAEDILNIKTSFGEEILPVPEIAKRAGKERRTGPATSEMFMVTFAPRGIEFGNWNNQEERQQVMNHAYDGLLDLADALELPPKALMLNGELAIAFGARGQGLTGAKAHYEPDYGVINLTKMKGAGSLGHEWMHAFDHYLARLDTKASSEKKSNERGDMVYKRTTNREDFQSHGAGYQSKLRAELEDAYRNLAESMYKKAEQYVEDTKKADQFVSTARENLKESLAQVKQSLSADHRQYIKNRFGKPASAEQLAEFDRLANVLMEGGDLETSFRYNEPGKQEATKPKGISLVAFGRLMSGRHSNGTLDGINAILKAVRNRTGFNKEQTGYLDRVRAALGVYTARLKMFQDAQAGTEKTKKVPTSFAIEAKKMDQARSGDYWSEPHEMVARAFAAYVEDKISEKGGQSDFLVYRAHGGILLPMIDGFVARPYPEGTEREAINKEFDKFIGEIKTRETDKGVEMYSATTDQTFAPTLADVQAIFKGQEVIQPGGENFPVYVKTRGGQYLTIETVNNISADEVAFEYAHGEKFDPETMRISGAYGDGVARLVRGVAGKRTLAHESIHFLEDAGIIDSGDVAILRGHVQELVRDGKMETANKQDIGCSEDRANFLADVLMEEKPPQGLVGKVVARVREFIDNLLEMIGGRTAGGVVRDIQKGKIFSRGIPGTRLYASSGRYSIAEMNKFVQAVDGKIDQGYISSAVAEKIKREAAPIRLRRDLEKHIGSARIKEITKAGYGSFADLVSDTAKHYTAIYEGHGRPLILVKKNGRARMAFVNLTMSPDGSYYDVGSALISREDYLKNKKLLWEGAQSLHRLSVTRSAISGQSDNKITGGPEDVKGKPQYALADEAERAAARAGSRGLAMMGARTSPALREAAGAFAKHWKEFWQPFSTVPDGDKILAKRYEAMGNVARAVRFIDEIHKKLDAYPDQVKKDMFWYLNGDIPLESLPEDVRETAKMLRRRIDVIGEMLSDHGIITEEQRKAHTGQGPNGEEEGNYIHYMYAKHVLGEDKPIFLTSTGKLNLTYTLGRNPNLTLQQRKELGLIEDASVAVPVGMGKALTDIAKFDYLAGIADNADWVWQPSLVKVPIGRPLETPIHGRTRRNVKMGIGKLVEEAKLYDKMMENSPTPEVAEIRRILHEALAAAEEASANMPGDFVQLPNSKGYGPLAGAYVRGPIADDLMPVLDVATDRGKLMNAIMEIERQGMAGFKMGKVALNVPTAVRNIISNIIQNNMRGRALAKIPGDIIRACESMKAKNEHYEEAFGMGLFHTNWFVSEINDVLDEFRKVKAGRIDQILIAVKNVAKYYGKIDDINKLAIFIEQREAGKPIDEAALEAMKWGMDYSLTSRSVKGLRQTIVPFATYQYKIAPLIAESLKKRPWVLAKFGLIYTVAKMIAMGMHDLDDDDWEDLEKQLPAYIKKSGSMMILPWKTNKGQWQWVNLEYFFPWGNFLAIARDMKAADLGEGLRDAGISNPFLSMFYTGLSAREDQPPLHSYFGTPIYNQLDPAPVKAAKVLEYMANTWLPSMATRQGALGYTGRAIAGGEDRWGREVSAGQALGRWFGVNIVSVSPEQTRAQASVRIQDLRKELARIEADPSYDEADKAAYAKRLNERLADIAQEAPAAVLPITKAKGKDTVYEALQAMAAKGTLHTALPSRSVEIAGLPLKMNMEQYGRYLEETSSIARARLLPLVSSPAWEAMSDKRQAEAVSEIVANARKGVRQKIKRDIQIDLYKKKAAEAAEKKGG